MEFQNLIQLIKTVSDSSLRDFCYEQENIKLRMKKTVLRSAAVHSDMPITQIDTIERNTEKAEGNVIKSPLIGRFYAAPTEEANPFVTIGDTVKKGQTVAIVEAMKLMNDIESDFDGVVAEVFVQNGETVEYGQPLFRII